MLPTLVGVEPVISWSPVGRASNWATETGLDILKISAKIGWNAPKTYAYLSSYITQASSPVKHDQTVHKLKVFILVATLDSSWSSTLSLPLLKSAAHFFTMLYEGDSSPKILMKLSWISFGDMPFLQMYFMTALSSTLSFFSV